MTTLRTPEQGYWSKVQVGGFADCWLWQAAKDRDGYGRYNPGPCCTARALAYRFGWELVKGPIPNGLTIDHLCHNRACQNPAHMELVPPEVNGSRGRDQNKNLAKANCPRGHAYDATNTHYAPSGPLLSGAAGFRRNCRRCAVIATRAYRARKMLEGTR